jgi:hypothetical protein
MRIWNCWKRDWSIRRAIRSGYAPSDAEDAMTESLTRLAEALRTERASVDPERVWRRVEARIDVPAHRPVSTCRPFTSPMRRWGAAVAMGMAVFLAVFLVWRQQLPTVEPAIEVYPVRLNLALWQPEAIVDDSMGSETEEMIALLEPDQ